MISKLPNYKIFFFDMDGRSANWSKELKSLGYKGKEKTVNTMDGPMTKGDYTYSIGDKSIKVHYETLMGGIDSKITIIGDDEALEKFYKNAKKLQGRDDWWYCDVKKKGNTVYIEGGMD